MRRAPRAPRRPKLDGQNQAHALGEELVLRDLGLQRIGVPCHQGLGIEPGRCLGHLVETQDLALVLRLALVVLLAIGHPDLGVGGHDDSGLGAVHACLERAAAADPLAVLVLGRVLAEVPDVPRGVLREPVVREFDELTVLGDRVADDDRLDAVRDRLCLARDLDNDLLVRLSVCRLRIDPPASDREGQVRVVDLRGELGGVEIDRLGALRQAGRDVLGHTACLRRRRTQPARWWR